MAFVDREGSITDVHLETHLIPDALWHGIIARPHPSLDAGEIDLGYHYGLFVGFADPKLSEQSPTANCIQAGQGVEYTQPSGNLPAAPIRDALLGSHLEDRQKLSANACLETVPSAL